MILKYFNGLINEKIKTIISKYMIQQKISFLEITLYLSEISEKFREEINKDFGLFGIEVVNFFCEAIAPSPEEYEKLRNYKEELSLGRDFYQTRRTLDIMEKFADNSSMGELAKNGSSMGLEIVRHVGNFFAEGDQSIDANLQEQTIACPKCGEKNNISMKYCGACGSELFPKRICPHCSANIPVEMKFCGECGKPFSLKCPSCGFDNQTGMKFCDNCGQRL